MPIFYKIDKERRIIMSTVSSPITIADALGSQQKLRNDPDFDPTFSQLVDATQLPSIDLDTSDLRRLAEGSMFSNHSRRAILVSSDVAFGLARMYETFRESAGETGIHIFRDLDQALDWILAKDAKA